MKTDKKKLVAKKVEQIRITRIKQMKTDKKKAGRLRIDESLYGLKR